MIDDSARVELTLRIGQFGERVETIAIPISGVLAHDLTEPVELSDDAMSLLLASPAVWGGRGDAITIRRKRFSMRRDVATALSMQIRDKLVELFGVEDEVDGYKKRDIDKKKGTDL